MKRPFIHFYTGDWQSNSNLRRCTHEEKGIWIDIMCILNDQEEHGIVRWSLKELALAIGTSTAKIKGLIDKGILKGAEEKQKCAAYTFTPTKSGRKKGEPVTLIAEQEGPLWYSSRMVVDEYKRNIRGESSSTKDYENYTPKHTPEHAPKGGIGADISAAPKPTPDIAPSRADVSMSLSMSVNPYSEGKPSDGKPSGLTPEEIIFNYGVPLLTNAGTAEKQARSFLGGLRKEHGDQAVVDRLRECLKAKPLQPIEWLAAALPPKPASKPGKHSGFEKIDYGKGVSADGRF